MRSLLLAALLALAPTSVHAQRDADVHALATVCASELAFRGSVEECAAIAGVLERRATRFEMAFSAFARVYAASAFDTDRRDERGYLAHLRLDGREPAQWPTTIVLADGRVVRHAPWRHYQRDWLGLVEAARSILRGELIDPCPDADHWGQAIEGSVDMQRAERAGWERVCGDRGFRNAFWRVRRGEASRGE